MKALGDHSLIVYQFLVEEPVSGVILNNVTIQWNFPRKLSVCGFHSNLREFSGNDGNTCSWKVLLTSWQLYCVGFHCFQNQLSHLLSMSEDLILLLRRRRLLCCFISCLFHRKYFLKNRIFTMFDESSGINCSWQVSSNENYARRLCCNCISC